MNRTGFFICSYLVEVMKFSILDAFNKFKEARPPGIYREELVRRLFQKYKMVQYMPEVPSQPTWTSSESSKCFQPLNYQTESKDEERSPDKKPLFMYGMNGVEYVKNKEKSKKLRRKVQLQCSWHVNHQFPASQPVRISMQNLYTIFQKPYKVNCTLDGIRYMMLILGEKQIYLFDKDFNVFEMIDKFPLFVEINNSRQHLTETLLDGEMVMTSKDGLPSLTYLIRDVIWYENENVGNLDFTRRSLYIKQMIKARSEAEKSGLVNQSEELFEIKMKDFYDVSETSELLNEKFVKANNLTGLIFQPENEPYQPGLSGSLLEWNPNKIADLTIDFRVRIFRPRNYFSLPDTFAGLFLMNANDEQCMATINATDELSSNDGKIIRFGWDLEKKDWVPKFVFHERE